jgi:NhaA family Na+:H+ antiporter
VVCSLSELLQWHFTISSSLGEAHISLLHLINDGLMTVFFAVVELEIKREVLEGSLSSPRKALLPALAALGGMAMPALVFLLFNPNSEGARGWGIPIFNKSHRQLAEKTVQVITG